MGHILGIKHNFKVIHERLGRNELIKFTFVAFKVAEMSLPDYSYEYSKQTYTQHQLMALLSLMKRLRLKYLEILEFVD
jgi:hypothetical protein